MSGPSSLIFRLAMVAIVAATLGFTAIYVTADPAWQADLRAELARGLLQVIVLGILAWAVKVVLDRHEQERVHRAALRQIRVEALNQLTEAYFALKKALHVIDAYLTPEVYGEQVRSIIDQRYVLQRLSNEADGGLYELGDVEAFKGSLKDLDTPLDAIVHEWREIYPQLGRPAMGPGGHASEEVAQRIATLPVILSVTNADYAALREPFHRVAKPLRDQVLRDRVGEWVHLYGGPARPAPAPRTDR